MDINKTTPRKVRGTGIYTGDEFTFRPNEEGAPTQLNVRTTSGGKLFTTTSATKPMQVAHLSCSATASDPWTEYTDQLARLGIKPLQPAKLPTRQRLVADGGIEIYLEKKNGLLHYQGTIDLSRHTHTWQSEVMRQLQLMMRHLPMCDKFNKTITNLKKGESNV